MPTFKEKYEAIVRKDPAYEGIFYTAVKSTGIFCRPTCSARKPKIENVVFYDTTREALLNGFRPCKICKPLEQPGTTPEEIRLLIHEIDQEPAKKIKDFQLKERGIDPVWIRRWFKKHHGLTFHGYQRMIRINRSFQKIAAGQQVTHAAFDSGYESLSGFNDSFQSIFGRSPTKIKDKMIIHLVRFGSPLGPMFAGATDDGVCLAEFTDRRMLETEFKDLGRSLKATILHGTNPHLEQLQEELAEYFEGKRHAFTVPLHTPGTPFQRQVWKVLLDIPYGKTASYKEQARWLGQPNAVRAVARANGCNRVAIVIPCHRVIGENGHLTGYGGGLHRKEWLLDFERKNAGMATQMKLEL